MISMSKLTSGLVPHHGSLQFHPSRIVTVKQVLSTISLSGRVGDDSFLQNIVFPGCRVSTTCAWSTQHHDSGWTSSCPCRVGVRFSSSASPRGCNTSNGGVVVLFATGAAVPEDFFSQAESSTWTDFGAADPEGFFLQAESSTWTDFGSLSQATRESGNESDGEVQIFSDVDSNTRGNLKVDARLTTTVNTAHTSQDENDSSQPLESEETNFVQEYKLSEEGKLTTIKIAVGGTTRRTNYKIGRAMAQLQLQTKALMKLVLSFSVRDFIRNWGKKKPGLEDIKINPDFYEPKELSSIYQWTATELTLQRTQMVRIKRDTLYLVWAFTLFGVVRILEAVVAVFITSPPNFRRAFDAMNALDPFTVSSLAHALRQPIVRILDADPTNLKEVNSLKAKFWSELHNFYERQWKVMATLGVARLLTLIATNHPSAQWVTKKVKVLWDISLMLPSFDKINIPIIFV